MLAWNGSIGNEQQSSRQTSCPSSPAVAVEAISMLEAPTSAFEHWMTFFLRQPLPATFFESFQPFKSLWKLYSPNLLFYWSIHLFKGLVQWSIREILKALRVHKTCFCSKLTFSRFSVARIFLQIVTGWHAFYLGLFGCPWAIWTLFATWAWRTRNSSFRLSILGNYELGQKIKYPTITSQLVNSALLMAFYTGLVLFGWKLFSHYCLYFTYSSC